MKSFILLGITEQIFTEIEAVKPTPGYDHTTAIDWTNWGVTEATGEIVSNNDGSQWSANGPDMTTVYSLINLHDLGAWSTPAPLVENDKPTSFDDLLATTAPILPELHTTESSLEGLDEQTTSLLDLFSFTTQAPLATTGFELDLVTTEAVKIIETTESAVNPTTLPALPVFTTAETANNITDTATSILQTTEKSEEAIVVTTTDEQIHEVEEILGNKNGSLLWAKLHPVGDRIDTGEVTHNETLGVENIEVEEKIEVEIEVEEIVTNSTEVEVSVEKINPRIIATASTSALRPTLVLIGATLLTFMLEN